MDAFSPRRTRATRKEEVRGGRGRGGRRGGRRRGRGRGERRRRVGRRGGERARRVGAARDGWAAPPLRPPRPHDARLLLDILAAGEVQAGAHFCAQLGASAQAALPGCPIDAATWPELLRMVLLARSVAHAPKKRSVALSAMLSHGWGNAAAAEAAAAALGGGHTVSVWSAGGDGGAEDGADAAEADWAVAADALGSHLEYTSMPIEMRCLVVECLGQLLMETGLTARFFEASSRAFEKLQDLKRTEYKRAQRRHRGGGAGAPRGQV